jgi:hypothetical protein
VIVEGDAVLGIGSAYAEHQGCQPAVGAAHGRFAKIFLIFFYLKSLKKQ